MQQKYDKNEITEISTKPPFCQYEEPYKSVTDEFSHSKIVKNVFSVLKKCFV